jgi:hypothetical protein
MESTYQRIKRQKNLIIVFFLFLVVNLLILYFGYLKKEKTSKGPPQIPQVEKKIEIDFSVLENPILKELQPFEKIPPPNLEEIGRENPFSQIK